MFKCCSNKYQMVITFYQWAEQWVCWLHQCLEKMSKEKQISTEHKQMTIKTRYCLRAFKWLHYVVKWIKPAFAWFYNGGVQVTLYSIVMPFLSGYLGFCNSLSKITLKLWWTQNNLFIQVSYLMSKSLHLSLVALLASDRLVVQKFFMLIYPLYRIEHWK